MIREITKNRYAQASVSDWKKYSKTRRELGKHSDKAKEERTDLVSKSWPYTLFSMYWNIKQDNVLPKENLKRTLSKALSEYEFLKETTDSVYNEDSFEGEKLTWQIYNPGKKYFEEYNSFDRTTWITKLNHKLSKEEEKRFREKYYIPFIDPYCDGRDCTAAEFTGWMKFLRCADRTYVMHCIEIDC